MSPAKRASSIGGSGGLAVWAALQVAAKVDDPDALVVVLLPDSGRGYLSKIYNDDWMRENGFLSRFARAPRVEELVAHHDAQDVPRIVAVHVDDTVEKAIELLRELDISQLPVVRTAGGGGSGAIEVQNVAGSIQERTLLDKVFRSPETLKARISTVMDAPFPLVDAAEEVERVFPLLPALDPPPSSCSATACCSASSPAPTCWNTSRTRRANNRRSLVAQTEHQVRVSIALPNRRTGR